MEAMAMGLPTIATRWSGNLEFMNDHNSYLVGHHLVDAPQFFMRGQQWAEPSVRELRRAMRRVYEHRDEATATGRRARADVLVSCAPELVVDAVRHRLDAADTHPVHVALRGDAHPVLDVAEDQPRSAKTRGARAKAGRRITACVVVQDNAPSLPQCLASVADIADTTIVVSAAANDDMAAVRNAALDRATGGWVLMLDATHTLDPASVDLVRDLVDQDQFAGYAARELHQFGLDGAVSAVEQRTPVLFPRHPDLRYVGCVAEQLLPQRGIEFALGPSRIVVHQHDYRWDRHDPAGRARRHLPILERAVRESPKEPFHLYNLGVAVDHLGLHAEAEGALRRAVELAPHGATWLPMAYAALSRAVAAQGRAAEAAKLCKAATKCAPEWAQGWCMVGGALIDAGRLKGALRAYTRALDLLDPSRPSGDPDDAAWQARAGIGRIHLSRGEYGEAAAVLSRAVALNPSNAELRVWLARAYEAIGRAADARAELDRAMTIPRTGPEAYLAFGDFFTRKAEQALLRGLADNPENRALLDRLERLRAARVMA
jgi:tetratricopeptide (TPR) repeat protein